MNELDEMIRKKQEERAAKKMVDKQNEFLAAKKCGKCGLGMSQVTFGQHYRTKDGLQAWCSGCLVAVGGKGGRRRRVKPQTMAKLRQKLEQLTKAVGVLIDKSAPA